MLQKPSTPSSRSVCWLSRTLVIVLTACSFSCRGTDDYLKDLARTAPRSRTQSNSQNDFIYDRNQIAHEALSQLAIADDLTRAQSVDALARASRFILRADNTPLLRADAATLIAELTVRTPFLERGDGYDHEFDSKRAALMVSQLEEIRKPLISGGHVAALDSGDEVQFEAALERLVEESGQNYGRDIAAWKAWWEESRPERVAVFVKASEEPVSVLGGMRYTNASAAHAVLMLLNLWFREVGDAEVDRVVEPLLDRLARQSAVLCLIAGLRDPSPLVRMDVARAIRIVGDVSFGEPLRNRLVRETDDDVRVLLLAALAHYPSSRSIVSAINVMAAGDSRVRLTAHDVLQKMTGADVEPFQTAWSEWWRTTGEIRWP